MLVNASSRPTRIDTADNFVLSMKDDEWYITETYDNDAREQLVECLYQYVEYSVVLLQFTKVFDTESRVASISFPNMEAFVTQHIRKTFFSRYERAFTEGKKRKSYEKVSNIVNIPMLEKHYEKENYTPKMIIERIQDIQINAKNCVQLKVMVTLKTQLNICLQKMWPILSTQG